MFDPTADLGHKAMRSRPVVGARQPLTMAVRPRVSGGWLWPAMFAVDLSVLADEAHHLGLDFILVCAASAGHTPKDELEGGG